MRESDWMKVSEKVKRCRRTRRSDEGSGRRKWFETESESLTGTPSSTVSRRRPSFGSECAAETMRWSWTRRKTAGGLPAWKRKTTLKSSFDWRRTAERMRRSH